MEFTISSLDLRAFMELRNDDAMRKLKENFGGIDGLCDVLKTSSKEGLPSDNPEELELRQNVFGSNLIPKKPPKGFLLLCWEVLQVTFFPVSIHLNLFSGFYITHIDTLCFGSNGCCHLFLREK